MKRFFQKRSRENALPSEQTAPLDSTPAGKQEHHDCPPTQSTALPAQGERSDSGRNAPDTASAASEALEYRDTVLHAITLSAAVLVTSSSLDEAVPRALEIVGTAMDVDRVLVLEHDDLARAAPSVSFCYGWQAPAVATRIDRAFFTRYPANSPEVKAWTNLGPEGKVISGSLHQVHGPVRELFDILEIKSILILPIRVGGRLWGGIGIDSCRVERQWAQAEIDVFETLAEIVGSAIVRDRYVKQLADANAIVNSTPTGLFRLSAAEGFPALSVFGNMPWFGYRPTELLGRSDLYKEIVHPDDVGRVSNALDALRQGAGVQVIDCRMARAGRWVEARLNPIRDAHGTLKEVEGIVMDITERKKSEESLRASEEKFRTLSEAAQDAIIVMDARGLITFWNGAAGRIFGSSAEQALGRKLDEWLALPRYGEKAAPEFERLRVAGGASTGKMAQMVALRKDGTEVPIELSLAPMRLGTERFAIAIARDISERQRAEQKILSMARFDPLTGLFNRTIFVEWVQKGVARVKRGGKGFAILHLDLDHFKDVNDTLGHPTGDALLRAVAERLHSSIRETDVVARLGGDEFAIMEVDLNGPEDASVLARKLLDVLSQTYSIEGNLIRLSVSIGIALCGRDALTTESLLSYADVALYRAKGEGRNKHRFFTESMDTEVRLRFTLAAELREAVDQNQLFLVYQPQTDAVTGRIIGLESLVRWRHPQRGVLRPAEFIAAAEHSGLIIPLGQKVLQEACRQMKKWVDARIAPRSVSVNISAVQFKAPLELEQTIAATLDETRLPPEYLELELTETVLMETSFEHNDVLQRLKEKGIHLAIDDFGTGFSSFDYLRRYPVSRIKISQQFVRGSLNDASDAAIVKAIIGLARELHVDFIAEGVETAEQLEQLRAWGCRYVQGYYFAKPMSSADIKPLLVQGVIPPALPEASAR